MALHFQRCDIQEVHGVLKAGKQSRATDCSIYRSVDCSDDQIMDETTVENNTCEI